MSTALPPKDHPAAGKRSFFGPSAGGGADGGSAVFQTARAASLSSNQTSLLSSSLPKRDVFQFDSRRRHFSMHSSGSPLLAGEMSSESRPSRALPYKARASSEQRSLPMALLSSQVSRAASASPKPQQAMRFRLFGEGGYSRTVDMEEDLDAPHRDSGGVSGALTFDGKHNNTMRSDILPHQQSLGVTSYFNNDLAELPVGVLRHPEARFNLSGGDLSQGLDCTEPVFVPAKRRGFSADERRSLPWGHNSEDAPLPEEKLFPGTSQSGRKNLSGGKFEAGLTDQSVEEASRHALQTKQKGRSSENAIAAHSVAALPWGSESDVIEARSRSVEPARSYALSSLWEEAAEGTFEREMGRKSRVQALSCNPISRFDEGTCNQLETTMNRKSRGLPAGMLMSSGEGGSSQPVRHRPRCSSPGLSLSQWGEEAREMLLAPEGRNQPSQSSRSDLRSITSSVGSSLHAIGCQDTKALDGSRLRSPADRPIPRGRSPLRQTPRLQNANDSDLMAVMEEPDFDADDVQKISLRSLTSMKTPTRVAKKSTAPNQSKSHLYEFIAASPFPVFCPTPVPGIWVAPWGESPTAPEALRVPKKDLDEDEGDQIEPEGEDAVNAELPQVNSQKRPSRTESPISVVVVSQDGKMTHRSSRMASAGPCREDDGETHLSRRGSQTEERGPEEPAPMVSLRSRAFKATISPIDYGVERVPIVHSIYGSPPVGSAQPAPLRRPTTVEEIKDTPSTPRTSSPASPQVPKAETEHPVEVDQPEEEAPPQEPKLSRKSKMDEDLKITCSLSAQQKNQFVWALKSSSTETNALNIALDRARQDADKDHDTPPFPSRVCIARTGREGLASVAEHGAWNWVLVGPTAQELLGGGDGSIEEMRNFLASGAEESPFGLLRLGFGSGVDRQTKFVIVHTGACELPLVQETIAQFVEVDIVMQIADPEELVPETVVSQICKTIIADDHAGKNVFSISGYWVALAEEMADAKSKGQLDFRSTDTLTGKSEKLSTSNIHSQERSLENEKFGEPDEKATSVAGSSDAAFASEDCPTACATSSKFQAQKSRKSGKLMAPTLSSARRLIVSETAAPSPIVGIMLQQVSDDAFGHPRHFEVVGGRLKYWLSPVEKESGEAPRVDIPLTNVKVERKLGHGGKFKMNIGGASGQVFSVNADVPLTAHTHSREEWIMALKRHSAFTSTSRSATSMRVRR